MEYYTIKEASKRLGVETHVLRYWEEELGCAIKRNEMGHRYYDSKNIQMFEQIQRLKEQGLSLKDIRVAIEKYQKEVNVVTLHEDEKNETNSKDITSASCDDGCKKQLGENKEISMETRNDLTPQVVEFKTAQLQSIMNRVVANALRENKDIIQESVKGDVVKEVIHQFDLIMRENEEREDERFRRLDENLRKLQQANEEVAATRMRKRRWWKN